MCVMGAMREFALSRQVMPSLWFVKGDTNPKTTEVLVLIDEGFKLKILDDNAPLKITRDDHAHRFMSKLDNTHPRVHDNKAIHRMQPTTNHFTKMDFG